MTSPGILSIESLSPVCLSGIRKEPDRPCAGGLIPDETHFLNALKESVESGRVPADELIEKYRGAWGGDVTRVFGEYSY